jgi:Ni/Co efflux regulator RcnB
MTLLGGHQDTVVLSLAVVSTVAAITSLATTLRRRAPSPAAPSAEKEKEKEKGSSDADSDSDDDSDDKAKEQKTPLINDAYKLIHQRYNRTNYTWEEFDPVKDGEGHEGVIFVVYHRHYDPSAVKPLDRIVEVHSEALKEVLRGSLKHVDTVFDQKPMVTLPQSLCS